MSGKYIVIFKDTATQEQMKDVRDSLIQNGGSVTKEFNSDILRGFSGEIPDDYLQALKDLHSEVIDYIEQDQEVTTQ